jgi:hypothetical protein
LSSYLLFVAEREISEFPVVFLLLKNEIVSHRSTERVGVRECILIEVNVVDTACASRDEDKPYHGTDASNDDL